MRTGIYILFITISLCVSSISTAQTVDRNVAISAYIYNFAKNLLWQNEEQISSFRFHVVGNDKDLINEMESMSQTKKIRDKSIQITNSDDITDFNGIHLIFITSNNTDKIQEIYNLVEGKSTLIVTDRCKDMNNIMINFVDETDGSLKFEINKSNILGQHIMIMPDIILLGGTEIDVTTLYYEGQQSLHSLQQQIENLEQSNDQLHKIQNEVQKKLDIYQDSLKDLVEKIAYQQSVLEKQLTLLKQRENKIGHLNKEIQKNQNQFEVLSNKIEIQDSEIVKRQKILNNQQHEIDNKKIQIEEQYNTLKNQDITINRQRNLLYLLIIIVMLVIALIFVIYKSYRNKKKMNRELENKVRERTEELNTLNAELEDRVALRTSQLVSINKELESFSYSISHDLRAPLRAIYGFSQILSVRHKESLNAEGKQYIDYVLAASVRMEQLINDLLNFSRLGRKSIELHPVDLNDILKEMQLSFQQHIEEIEAELLIQNDLPIISADKSLLRQVFINLIGNAITYRRKETRLKIEITYSKIDKKHVIKVTDNGIGIKKEYWDKIFNIFQRLHSEDEYPGTGIGLATVKKSVELMHGEISVDSVFGEGSTFIIKFNGK